MLTLSTIHITPKTANIIERDSRVNRYPALVIYSKEQYGWFIYFDKSLLRTKKQMNELPEDLRNCIAFAKKNRCDMLCLDGDGPEEPDLPTYGEEWDAPTPCGVGNGIWLTRHSKTGGQ